MLFEYSSENNIPIEIIYMSGNNDITHRTIIVRKIIEGHVQAFDLQKQQIRTFKLSNILSAAKIRRQRGVNHA